MRDACSEQTRRDEKRSHGGLLSVRKKRGGRSSSGPRRTASGRGVDRRERGRALEANGRSAAKGIEPQRAGSGRRGVDRRIADGTSSRIAGRIVRGCMRDRDERDQRGDARREREESSSGSNRHHVRDRRRLGSRQIRRRYKDETSGSKRKSGAESARS